MVVEVGNWRWSLADYYQDKIFERWQIDWNSHRIDDSPVWSDLLKVKQFYMPNRKIKVHNGLSALFWEDPWFDDKPLCLLYPVLYELCADKWVSVHHFLSNNAQLQFTRWLSPILFTSWLDLVNEIYNYPFDNSQDVISWKCNKNGVFSTRSVYDSLTSNDQGISFNHIWKARIPHRIKVFMWLLENNAVLTKDNLLKKNWLGSPTCYFCSSHESIDHLFFLCPIAKVLWGLIGLCIGASNIPGDLTQYKQWISHWLPGGQQGYTFCVAAICWAIWKKRNSACFENKRLKNPAEILSYACALMSYWAGLYGVEMQGKIVEGVKLLLSCASRMMVQQQHPNPPLLLPPAHSQVDDMDDSTDAEAWCRLLLFSVSSVF